MSRSRAPQGPRWMESLKNPRICGLDGACVKGPCGERAPENRTNERRAPRTRQPAEGLRLGARARAHSLRSEGAHESSASSRTRELALNLGLSLNGGERCGAFDMVFDGTGHGLLAFRLDNE